MDPYRFDPARLEVLRNVEAGHFWFRGRRRLVEGLLRKCSRPHRLLDAGCGTGYQVDQLRSRGYEVVGVDPLAAGDGLLRAAAEALPFRPGSFDGILFCDVLEHVEDQQALAEARRVLRDPGWMVVTVPAYPWLWSHRDEEAGHRCRYTREVLHRKVREAGFSPVWTSHYQCLLLPLMVLNRLSRRRGARDAEDRPGAWLNLVLGWITSLELMLGRWIPLPWGSSLVLLAQRKPQHDA